jgi:hypothetical protein
MLQGEDQQYTKKAGSARTARPLSRPCFLSFLQFLVYLPIEHWLSTYLDERSVVKGLVFFFWFSNSNNRAELSRKHGGGSMTMTQDTPHVCAPHETSKAPAFSLSPRLLLLFLTNVRQPKWNE